MITQIRRVVASLLIVSLVMPIPARAALISTESTLGAERERIAEILDRTDVQAQLQAYGANAADVKARVAALTEAEAAELAAKIDELPAGGADILGVALIVFLVLLFTDIMGWTKIFPFTKSVK